MIAVVGWGALLACTGVESTETDPTEGDPPTLAPDTQVDLRVQLERPAVDVLFVVDTSGAVTEAQQAAFFASVPSFVDYFADGGVSYHLGWITTDMEAVDEGGRLQGAGDVRFVTDEDEAPAEVFASWVRTSEQGAPARPVDAVYASLQLLGRGDNAGFRRPDAGLHVAVLHGGSDQSELVTAQEFVDWHALFTQGSPPSSFSVVSDLALQPFDDLCASLGGFHLTNSDVLDWSVQLPVLGVEAAPRNFEFLLSRRPLADTI
ncbi:MAG: hypothetical protein KTR31_19505 [Myxococcales bacterium]|nr:hypothetical protein [Myxococcales bacterium]